MKIIANNFSGTLNNGFRYRISVETTPKTVVVKLQLFEAILELWYADYMNLLSYEGDYHEKLRALLTEVEEKYNIKLVKAELNIAV